MKHPPEQQTRMRGSGIGSFDTTVGVDLLAMRPNGVFERLRESEYFGIRRFLARKLGNEQDAQELTQEVFLKVWKAGDLGAIDNLKAFVYRVASNLAVDLMRRRRREGNWLAHLTLDEENRARNVVGLAFSEQDRELARKQRIEAIMDAIKGLPVNCQKAFILNKFSGLDYNQVAAEMGVSKSMVEKHISRALASLRAVEFHEMDEDVKTSGVARDKMKS